MQGEQGRVERDDPLPPPPPHFGIKHVAAPLRWCTAMLKQLNAVCDRAGHQNVRGRGVAQLNLQKPREAYILIISTCDGTLTWPAEPHALALSAPSSSTAHFQSQK
jgi:hypothetical protein